jgi:diacylglycerol kinase family enzyme
MGSSSCKPSEVLVRRGRQDAVPPGRPLGSGPRRNAYRRRYRKEHVPRVVVLANGSAGAEESREKRVAAIRAAFRAAGADPPVRCVEGDSLAASARAAIRGGGTRIVAAGGDGTISALVRVVAGTKVELGVLAMGTANHFAKDAGLPLDLEEAARVALRGVVKPVDVGEVNGRAFVNNVSIGLYPAAVRERERNPAQSGPRILATTRAAGTVLKSLQAHHLLLSIDGRPAVKTTSFILIGNNEYETRPLRLGRRSSITGGVLSVYTVRRPGRRAVVGLAARALVGRLDASRDFESHLATGVVVDSHRRHLRITVDGELARPETPLRFSVRKGALRLLQEA